MHSVNELSVDPLIFQPRISFLQSRVSKRMLS